MGKSYSKQEEIVIAQNGANGATSSVSEINANFKLYGTLMLIVFVLLVLMFTYFCMSKCKRHSQKWIQRQVRTLVPENISANPMQMPQQVVYNQ